MKVLLSLIVVAAAFVAGIAGAIVAVPSVAPEQADAVRARLDSLRAARRAAADALAHSAPALDSLTMVSAESGRMALSTDSSATDSSATDSSATDSSDVGSSMACFQPVSEVLIAALRDSLDGARRADLAHLRQADSLQAALDSLRRQQARLAAEQATHRADLAALSKTVTRLEDGELAALLERLDAATLTALYAQASARSRTRLLQTLPSDEAAALVGRLVDPEAAGPAAADTLALSTAAALEPGAPDR